MSTTVTYKGSTLATVDNQTRTLKTAGKYMEDDVTLVDVSSTGGYVIQDQDGFIVLPPDGDGGGGSSYTLLTSAEFEVNTTSTSLIDVGTIQAGVSAFTSAKILYVKIRDKAGPRSEYYLGSDCFFFNPNPANGGTSTWSNIGIGNYRYYGDSYYNSSNTYGIFAYSVDSSGDILIRARYSSVSSSTINGTFKIDVYLLEWPDSISPYT